MPLRLASLVLLAVVCSPALLPGQYTRTRRGANNAPTGGGHKGLIITIHGSLKKLTKKELLIQTDGDQIQTIRLSHTTKFMKAGKEIKPYEADLESLLTLDVIQDVDLKFIAVTVTVDVPPKPAPQ